MSLQSDSFIHQKENTKAERSEITSMFVQSEFGIPDKMSCKSPTVIVLSPVDTDWPMQLCNQIWIFYAYYKVIMEFKPPEYVSDQ